MTLLEKSLRLMRLKPGASLFRRTRPKSGQLSSASSLGRWLFHLCREPDVQSILEVGTWNGLGSTRLISRALQLREDSVNAVSLEINRSRHMEALENLGASSKVKLLWGSLVQESEFDTSGLSEVELGWLDEDLEALRGGTYGPAPLLKEDIPKKLDLVFLDGGEFSSYAEFKALESSLQKWLLLDDTFVRKNRAVEQELERSELFARVASGKDRNGWSVWLKIG